MKIIISDNLSPILAQQWKKLWKSSPNATMSNSPMWFAAAEETYHYHDKKIIALYSTQNLLVGIGAFTKETIGGLSVWTPVAREFAGSYSVLLDYKKTSYVQNFFQEFADIGPVLLTNYKTDLLTAVSLKNVSSLEFDKNHYIDLQDSTTTTHLAAKMRRIEKKLKKDGMQVTYIPQVENRYSGLQEAFAIEATSSKQMHGKGVFGEKIHRDFYQKLLEKASDLVSISFIQCNQKNIAYSINFKEKTALQGSQKAHLRAYSQYSPGKLLIQCLIDYARSKNHQYFDLGRGDDEFKRSLSSRNEPLFLLIVSNNIFVRKYLTTYFLCRDILYKGLISLKPLYQLYKLLQKGGLYGQYTPAKN